MKPTKRAKKNQARQKLKLESAIAIKEATQEDKILDNPTNIKSEIIFLIITLVFTGIMIFLMGAIRMNPFADNGGPYVKAEEALIETNSVDKGNAILEKHHVEGLKINNNSQPSNEDYQKALSFNTNLLDYFNTVNKTREDLSNKSNNDDKETRRVRIVPAVENQKIANEQPNIDDLIITIKEHGLTLAYLFFVMVGLLLYSEHRKEKKIRLAYIEEDESQSEVAPTILKINNHKDLTRYSNKL